VLDLLLRFVQLKSVHLKSFLKFLKEAPVIACESLLFFTSSVSHRAAWSFCAALCRHVYHELDKVASFVEGCTHGELQEMRKLLSLQIARR
jgi:hypothetical protein